MPDTSTRRIRLADIAAAPWKNGGGITREIATGGLPDGAPGWAQEWGWRVSLAEVAADGPFSIFPETDRVIAVIDGKGMDLLHPDGTVLALEPFVAVQFRGEDPFDGRLRGGPVRDLNVMVRRGLFTAEMEIRQGPGALSVEIDDGDVFLLHALTGGCGVRVDDAAEDLAPAETLVHAGPCRFRIQIGENGRAAVIRVLRR